MVGFGMETEKQFIDFVAHVFTLSWAIWALPLSVLLSFLSSRVGPGLLLGIVAVALHHVAPVALETLLAGGDMGTLPDKITAMSKTLEPLSLIAEYVSYAFLIIVFGMTRVDMFRPGVGEHQG
jgi:MFS superfamily sulfate permease-like transporter